MKDKLKALCQYNPNAVHALNVFLQGPSTSLRKIFRAGFNSLYYLGKAVKHRDTGVFSRMTTGLTSNDFPAWDQASDNRNVVIIAELSIPQCTMYRVDSKKIVLEKLGYTVEVVNWHDSVRATTYLQMADFVIFYRVPYVEPVKQYYQEADRLHLVKFYDVDDLIFDIPLYEEYLAQSKIKMTAKEKKILLDGAKLYREAILHADIFLTSTQAIRDVYDQIPGHKPSYVLPNGIPEELLKVRKTLPKKLQSDTIKIFYGAGSNTHNADFEMIGPAVAAILKEYPNVHLFLLGQLELDEDFSDVKDRVHRITRLSSDNYFREIAKFDIALMPLTDTFFNSCKSNIKYIEASLMQIPSVASNLYEFKSAIIDGQNGFLGSNEREWHDKLATLVMNPALRQEFTTKAFARCSELYGLQKQCEVMKNVLQECSIWKEEKQKYGLEKKKPRILQVNLYYGIDTFGGATIVVENLAQEMAKMKDKVQDVYAFTIHKSDSMGMGTLRKYPFQGATVFSCAETVDELKSINDKIVNKNFALVLKSLKPDIVHFHAVQGFGYGLGKICQKYGVPYVMTLHDIWALCPRLFMVDLQNEHCFKYGTSIAVCEKHCKFSADWMASRRNSLFDFLKGAEKLYVPSCYSQTSMEKVLPDFSYSVNKNGIDIESIPKSINAKKKIRFLFVAGESESKGYGIIRETLLNLLKYDWELTLLLPSGTLQKQWPKDRVKVLGRQNRKQMAQVYANTDVLLFPSLGYESFGLTVREAIASDCFVITSDCGGPAEAVVDGQNGFIVPRGDKNLFKKKVEYVLTHAQDYMTYKTQNYGDIRTYKEQAEELVKDYCNI